jgi:hypothetical protein
VSIFLNTNAYWLTDKNYEVDKKLALWKKAENLVEGVMEKFPKPDRSAFQPNPNISDQNPELDIGWGKGRFADERPYRGEFWTKDQESFLIFFFSIIGLEEMSKEDFPDYLVKEGLIKFIGQKSAGQSGYTIPPKRRCGRLPFG